MENQIIVGIDVSSTTLDICLRRNGENTCLVIGNNLKAVREFFKAYQQQCLLIGLENTGRYNWALYQVLASTKHRVFVISPLHLKKSLGLIRGKNDKIDAQRIAAFTQKNYGELTEWKATPAAIQKLKVLLTERNYRIKTKRQLLSQQADYAKMKFLDLDKSLLKMNEELCRQLTKQIQHVEDQIQALIAADYQLSQNADLIRSVPGAGKVLCWMLLAKTENFRTIQQARKMACYSGVVPFEHQSGSSIKRKPRVCSYADKSIKTILHMAAMSAIRLENDLRVYYRRKVAEGKNKMSVLNAVRNKILHRIFAVIHHQKPYQNPLLLS